MFSSKAVLRFTYLSPLEISNSELHSLPTAEVYDCYLHVNRYI
jgi:hypothetical protein